MVRSGYFVDKINKKRKGPDVFVACQEEILKTVSDNLERKLPDPDEVAESLVHKLT